MITPTTVRNGVDVTKLGIGPCSFFGRRGDRFHHEVGAGDGYHLDLVPRGNLHVGSGSEVVGRSGEADQNRTELVGGDADRNAARRADHVLEAEGLRRLSLTKGFEGAENDAGAEQAGDHPDHGCAAWARVEAVEPEEAADPE